MMVGLGEGVGVGLGDVVADVDGDCVGGGGAALEQAAIAMSAPTARMRVRQAEENAGVVIGCGFRRSG